MFALFAARRRGAVAGLAADLVLLGVLTGVGAFGVVTGLLDPVDEAAEGRAGASPSAFAGFAFFLTAFQIGFGWVAGLLCRFRLPRDTTGWK